jgi:serine phosphatase RsbU (regulator of sigma subunit)
MESQPASDSPHRLQGRQLTFWRAAWLLTAVLMVGLLIAVLPATYVLYQKPCEDILCAIRPQGLSSVGAEIMRTRGMPTSLYAIWFLVLDLVFALTNIAVAAIVFWRKSDDRMALFVSFTLLLFSGATLFGNGSVLTDLFPAWQAPMLLVSILSILCLSIFLCVFPNGRFVPTWMRWVAIPFAILMTVASLINALPTKLIPQPLIVSVTLILIFVSGTLGAVIAAQVYRYRYVSTRTEQQQTKWVVFGMAVGIGGFFALITIGALLGLIGWYDDPILKMLGNVLVYAAITLLPLSIGLAILRSRLYEVDILIRRTLIYGVLTVILAAAYLFSLFGLQYLLLGAAGEIGPASIVIASASALAMAAISRPLRSRIQDAVDRRFYRRKYDAAKVIAAFGSNASRQIDAERLTAQLLSILQETMQPEHVSLTLAATPAPEGAQPEAGTIPRDDPLAAHFRAWPDAVSADQIAVDSPALRAMLASGVKVVAPIVSEGEFIGVLALGPRLSQQDYSAEDRELLNALTSQAAPALRVAQLVRERQMEQEQQARRDQEMQLARQIQHALLPSDLPEPSGWILTTFYQPARDVGGDFYDVIPLSNGQLAIVIGDVTDKGMPAALLMATTRTTIRAIAQNTQSPGEVLRRVNEIVCRDIPERMFVTCFYAVLDPGNGQVRFANAGHDTPVCWIGATTAELSERGMPLGLLPKSLYEEGESVLKSGEAVLFYTDGIVEAHSPTREMFGFPRLHHVLAHCTADVDAITLVRRELSAFTGANWEQEDDITMLSLRRERQLASV